MTQTNPYQSPSPNTSVESQSAQGSNATYNVVSDVVTGLNVRKSDNLFQIKFIGISVLLFAVCGGIGAGLLGGRELPWFGGAIIAAFLGLLFGLFGSGIFLMVYRAIRHAKGHHD